MSVILTIRSGRHSEPLPALLLQWLPVLSPTWLWVEPTPTKERLENFPGWWSGADAQEVAWPAALDEARLLWPGASLALVTDGAATRWAWQSLRAECPEMLGDGTAAPFLAVEPTKPAAGGPSPRLGSLRINAPAGAAESLQVVEYRRGTQLICWMLKPPPNSATIEE